MNEWRWVVLCCVTMVLLGRAQTTTPTTTTITTTETDPGDGASPMTATSAATISVLDAFRVVKSFTWWGVDLTMETAGYGTS